MRQAILLVLVAFCWASTCAEGFVPSYIKKCDLKTNFEKCVKDQMQEILPLFAQGIKELDVPSLEPVKLDDIHIDGNGLKLTFSKAELHGVSESIVQDFKINIKDEQFVLRFKANLNLTAQYEIDGRILILPIQGKGDSVVKAKNIEVEIKSKLSHAGSGKSSHFKLLAPNYTYKIEKTTFQLENLFNGNKQLAETTLQFLNENWQQIMDDLAPPVVKQIVRTGVKNINKFFAKLTVNELVDNY